MKTLFIQSTKLSMCHPSSTDKDQGLVYTVGVIRKVCTIVSGAVTNYVYSRPTRDLYNDLLYTVYCICPLIHEYCCYHDTQASIPFNQHLNVYNGREGRREGRKEEIIQEEEEE